MNHDSFEVMLYLKNLLLTIGIEVIVLFIALRFLSKINKIRYPSVLVLTVGTLASLATLPYVWFVFPVLITDRQFYLAVSECFAWIVETIIYMTVLKLPFKTCLLISLVCNATSFITGLILYAS